MAKRCPRCNGRMFWEPFVYRVDPHTPGEWSCINCGHRADETDDEVAARTGKRPTEEIKAAARKAATAEKNLARKVWRESLRAA